MILRQTNLQNNTGKAALFLFHPHAHQIAHPHAVSHAVIANEIKKVSVVIPAIINSSLILIPII